MIKIKYRENNMVRRYEEDLPNKHRPVTGVVNSVGEAEREGGTGHHVLHGGRQLLVAHLHNNIQLHYK